MFYDIYTYLLPYIERKCWFSTKLVCKEWKGIGDKVFIPYFSDLSSMAERGNYEAVKFLITNFDFNSHDYTFAFCAAERNGHDDIILLLYEKRLLHWNKIKSWAAETNRVDLLKKNNSDNLLWHAVRGNAFEASEYLITQENIDINHCLGRALEEGYIKIAYLIAEKATCLVYFYPKVLAEMGETKILEFLYERGLIFFDHVLKKAIKIGWLEGVKILIRNIENINAYIEDAKYYKQREIYEYLINH